VRNSHRHGHGFWNCGKHCKPYHSCRFLHMISRPVLSRVPQLRVGFLSIHSSIHPSTHPSIHPSVYPSIHPSLIRLIYKIAHLPNIQNNSFKREKKRKIMITAICKTNSRAPIHTQAKTRRQKHPSHAQCTRYNLFHSGQGSMPNLTTQSETHPLTSHKNKRKEKKMLTIRYQVSIACF
jgi:hypothetical protein